MELWTGVLSWWKCHWPNLKSAGLFLGISFWTPLKPQHSNPNPNPLANQLWSINFLLLPHLSSSLTDSLRSLNLLCHSKTDVRFMQDAPKAVWRIPYVSVAFPQLKTEFYCIFEIRPLWQSGVSRVYSNCCCRCLFEPEIIKIGKSSHKMYSNNIVNFQESTTILNAHKKKGCKLILCTSGNFLNGLRIYIYIYVCVVCVCVCVCVCVWHEVKF